MISQNLLSELKIILKEEYGKKLNEKQVFETANSLIGFFDTLAKIQASDKQQTKNPK